MTAADNIIFNTLEQLVSGDLNGIGSLASKAVGDLAYSLNIDPANIFTILRPRDVVRRGLGAAAAAGLSVDIEGGDLYRLNTSVSFDDSATVSPYQLGRLSNTTNVSVGPADGAQPRVALISAAVSQVNTGTQTRNILSLPSRAVTPTPIPKRAVPRITLNVTMGTPSANPELPATPTDEVALWAVYIPAAATSIDPNHLCDMRVFSTDWSTGQLSGRERGYWVYPDPANTANIRIERGQLVNRGHRIIHTIDESIAATELLPSGSGSLTADAEYHLYALSIGTGVPIGVGNTNFAVYVLSTIAPTDIAGAGSPSAPLTFRPLFRSDASANNWQLTTQAATYMGTLHTDSTGALNDVGYGRPQNTLGTNSLLVASTGGISPAARNGWVLRPKLSWVDADTVRVSQGTALLAGMPVSFAAGNATMTGNLASGETETPSTFYYLYVRRARANTTRGQITDSVFVLSSEAPGEGLQKPTPETGFVSSDYCYAGSVLNNPSNDLVNFRVDGNQVTFIPFAPELLSMPNGGFGPVDAAQSLNNATASVFEGWAPATSRTLIAYLRVQRAAASATFARVMHGTGNANDNAVAAYLIVPNNLISATASAACTIIGDANNQWEAYESVSSDLDLFFRQTGYIEEL